MENEDKSSKTRATRRPDYILWNNLYFCLDHSSTGHLV